MKAPEPNLTSSTRAERSSASFLLRMLATISGVEPTVAVTSRKAYSLRSAGTRSSDAPVMTQPTASMTRLISSRDRSVRNPGMDSSLSSVPPVGPRPRPEIMGTCSPQQVKSGARMSEVLSPMPPVECLSTRSEVSTASSVWPEASMAWVSATVSSAVMPRMNTAIAQADIWQSCTVPAT